MPPASRSVPRFRLGSLVAAGICAAATAHALTYVLSDAGLEPPAWESGRATMVIADVNGDGHPDILSLGDHGNPYVNTSEHGIMAWLGNGAGGWTLQQNGGFGYGGIAVGDADGDGLADVAIAMHHNDLSSDFGDQFIEVERGDGTGVNWTPWDDGLATDGETYGMFGVVFLDMDGDGDLDLVSLSFGCCNGLHAYRNGGLGTWLPTWRVIGGNSTQDLSTGDVNGDGLLDVAAGSQNGTVWLSDGTGGFTDADGNLPAPGNLGLRGPSLGDVNGDGDADVAFATSSGGVQVWTWGDSSHWTKVSAGLPANGPFEATQLADVDGDGFLDLIAFGTGTCVVWRGTGTGAWLNGARITLPSPGTYAALAPPTDIDHNGRADIALVSASGSGLNTLNHPHLLRESTAAATLRLIPTSPRPRETWRVQTVRDIRWMAEIPTGATTATVDLAYSVSGAFGPWDTIATGIPASGSHQWVPPVRAPSDSCYVRYTLHAGDSTIVAMTSTAFRLIGGPVATSPPADGPPRRNPIHVRWRAGRVTGESTVSVRWQVITTSGRGVRDLGTARTVTWDPTADRAPRGVYLLVARRGATEWGHAKLLVP